MEEYQAIKQQLETRLAELKERAEELDDDLSETPDQNWSEHAIEAEDDEVLEHLGLIVLDEIRQIERALAEIVSGTYGECVVCEEKIPLGRLKAIPWATRCVKCAEEEERAS